MTSPQILSWLQLNEAISAKREELRQLEEHAAFMRDSAIATVRNVLRAYDISLDELNSSMAADEMAARSAHENGRKIRRVSTPRPAAAEQGNPVRDAGPLSRLSSTVKTVLANQGLKTFEAIARAADGGEIRKLQQMGPTRQAQLDAWLTQERAQPPST